MTEKVKSLGAVLTAPYQPNERQDIKEARILSGALIDLLHVTMGHTNDNPIGATLISQAINQVILAQMMVEKALYFCDEIGIDLEAKQEEETE